MFWGSVLGYFWEVSRGVLEGFLWYFEMFLGDIYKEQLTY